MAQYRQSGTERGSIRNGYPDHISLGVHTPPHKQSRHRRSSKPRKISFGSILVSCILLSFIILVFLARDHFGDIEGDRHFEVRSNENGAGFLSNFTEANTKIVMFGHSSIEQGKDSRYWDKDDRRRSEDHMEIHDKLIDNRKIGSGYQDEQGNTNVDDISSDEHGMEKVPENDEMPRPSSNASVAERIDGIQVTSSVAGKVGSGKGKKSIAGFKRVMPLHYPTKKAENEKLPDLQKKPKHHRFSGTSCEMKLKNESLLSSELPEENLKFARFSLRYTQIQDPPVASEDPELSRFGGHQSLEDRERSFSADSNATVNCGFVTSAHGDPRSPGFDLTEADTKYISTCRIAVVSCIFGNSDRLRSPPSKTVSSASRKNVCFVMFVDEESLQMLSSEGQNPDASGFVGLWRVVVVRNLPYADMRRVGKIPKLLPHRLFPSARYSIWLDSKLRLQVDPVQVLDYLLWRKGHEYAISNHYDRHCLWEEVAQNKKLNKYDHAVINRQFDFYRTDGMKRFNASDPDRLLPSNVPEGSFIVREHTPMSNLFSCLWFNEVHRFTPRDQLSFAYTFYKFTAVNPTRKFHLNMFRDCERRAVAKLFHHRADEKHRVPVKKGS